MSTTTACSARRVAHAVTVLATAAVLTAGLVACGEDSSGAAASSDDALQVVATTTQGADFARVIGGDAVEVTQLLQPGTDPHDYEPSPADLEAIGTADVLVTNGIGLESWLDDAVSASGFEGSTVVMADGVTLRDGDEHADEHAEDEAEHGDEEDAHGEHSDADEHDDGDPHIWHDPRNVKIMVTNIQDAFATAAPDHADDFRASLETYTTELDELDTEIQAKIATIPADRRKLVTNHDSLGYYTDRYGLEYIGSIIPSFDTSAELSGQAIDDIVQRIRDAGVVAVFSESSLPERTAQTIGREAGVTVIAGEDALYADTLGVEGSAGATYLASERHNTDTIVKALR